MCIHKKQCYDQGHCNICRPWCVGICFATDDLFPFLDRDDLYTHQSVRSLSVCSSALKIWITGTISSYSCLNSSILRMSGALVRFGNIGFFIAQEAVTMTWSARPGR